MPSWSLTASAFWAWATWARTAWCEGEHRSEAPRIRAITPQPPPGPPPNQGIPIGKLALYVACAGLDPARVLPVTLDVGTETASVREDPLYLGLRQRRVRGAEYDAFVDEFVAAAQQRWGRSLLLQFEDFGNHTAFEVLQRWRARACCFNDDIQGTAAVALGGIMAAARLTGVPLAARTYLFMGAGEAGTGIANLIAYAIAREAGCSEEEARRR